MQKQNKSRTCIRVCIAAAGLGAAALAAIPHSAPHARHAGVRSDREARRRQHASFRLHKSAVKMPRGAVQYERVLWNGSSIYDAPPESREPAYTPGGTPWPLTEAEPQAFVPVEQPSAGYPNAAMAAASEADPDKNPGHGKPPGHAGDRDTPSTDETIVPIANGPALTRETPENPAPVPEPGTLALVPAALGVLWLAARRARR